MNPEYGTLGKQFRTPEEEVVYLRAQIVEKEHALGIAPGSPERTLEARTEVAREKVEEYRARPAELVLDRSYQMKIDDIETNVVKLGVEHKQAVDQLMQIAQEKGIKNALAILEKLNNPHIEDDFHRMIVQLLLETGDFAGIAKDKEVARALKMRLYEITLPPIDDKGQERKFADLVSGMENFFAGMLSIENTKAGFGDVKNYFTIELALSNFSDHIVFYSAVPLEHANLFEKQVLAVYPDAKIREHREDYNPFNENGVTVASYATSGGETAYPLRTFETFTQDPLNVLLSAFSKINRDGEGVAVQFVIRPAGNSFNSHYKFVLDQIKKGVKPKDALKSTGAQLAGEFADAVKGMFFAPKEKKEVVYDEETKNIGEKIASPIVDTNIRIIASADTDVRAESILNELESAFNQFGKPQANEIKWKRETKGASLMEAIYRYTFRMFNEKESFPLNLREIATMFHFPVTATSSSELKEARAGGAPAPTEMSPDGIILGKNIYHNKETLVRLGREERVRHMYVIGQTGVGKSVFLRNMIMQDIKNGDGVCFIDPHGNDVQDILALIPPERADDVIYFDPSYTARPMGLNMLEYDERFPEQKTFVVNEMMGIFSQLFDMKVGGGAMFELYFRNAAALVMEDTASGSTLLEITRVLSDKTFRDMKLAKCKNPIILQFWASAEKTTGDQGLANFVPYISSKFDPFISNEIMRPVVLQQKSSFNFRQIMDDKKILLVNLSKGRLGDINANLIGLVLIGKITMAALSRVDMFGTGKKPNDFYLYIDEFYNFTTPSIATILSEARKYRLGLTVAHQFIAQLSDNIKNAVFGNVGNMAVFRVSVEDAEFLEKKFAPTFTAQDIMKLDNINAYVSMLVNGQPSKPFNITALTPEQGNPEMAEQLKQLSYLKYGAPREEVEAEIMGRYRA
ncbi:MAG: hypothetical protein COV32_02810 [Candidatus Yonathbacteria bacterium CG10_big_fil_rev_8_21_14_0_10_43_136]|uniref:TraD/TraG TraM recognition site domain-containing protein n=2 Tax=Parcubacteria group TaxID=1794811 RepID=A0A2M7Q417_9BACT|nr:MAG: hypothetical protein AUK15_02355 [Candidatus Nomurabacteria bacterium CG2_30_43_9]PIQ35651.1 MAG: hypothetical protein COW60_02740 [Candidatus Yonathbacteria bacterium CG17_big_fil_post_rev_8_21_14_2_50_43_9]PIR40544.1 MAG: hypothetical protein COV32_02810 [Candidatus Yonathbacteria bacterium CG10_big_fil_rev_8_21_14_0_10_43_136]PIY58143.1 MAG: hypothetical protein COY98_03795 [Candidatus Yonathbacteria bacterium CG_4_10_14_0_8_um_filter_43_17]PJC22069.1 MAG: hypothetical protein CO060_